MLLPTVLFLSVACRPVETKPSSVICGSGFVLDGSVCVPESCGTGRWGDLPVDGETVYVDGAAGEGGDGTEEAPYAMIQRGLDRAGDLGGALVAVAAGTYPETLELTTEHADVHLGGRCRDLVTLDASAGDEEMPGIYADLGYTSAIVSGLSVMRAQSVGILVASGSLRVEDSRSGSSADVGIGALNLGFGFTSIDVISSLMDGNSVSGILAQNAGTTVHVSQSWITGTLPGSNGLSGHGIEVIEGAVLTADSCTITANASAGMLIGQVGTEVTVTDTLVSDTQPDGSGTGSGIAVADGAHLRMENSAIERNFGLGLEGMGVGTLIELVGSAIRDTRPDPESGAGFGIQVRDGADIIASGCVLEGNTGAGVLLDDPGTEGTLRDFSILDTFAPSPDHSAPGIQVGNGAELRLSGGLLSGNAGVGIHVVEPGSRAQIEDTIIRDTRLSNGMGDGIDVTDGATLVMDACDLDGNARNGLMVNDPGSLATVRNSVIHNTQPDDNGQDLGVLVTSGASLLVQGSLIERNHEGLSVEDGSTVVVIQDTVIRGSDPAIGPSQGFGIQIVDQAWLFLDSCLVEGFVGIGLLVDDPGTRVIMVDSTVQDTLPDPDGLSGVGVQVSEGASFAMERSLLDRNRTLGLHTFGEGTEASIVDSTIRNTLPDATGSFGFGLDVTLGSHVAMESSVIEANLSYGARAVDPGTEFRLVDTIIRDNADAGVNVYATAYFSADDCLVEGNAIAGIISAESGTQVYLRDTIVSDTRTDADGHDGFGLSIEAGASLEADDCLVEDSAAVGVLAQASGTTVALRNTIIRGEGASARGIEVQDGAQLSAWDCEVAAYEDGVFVAGTDAVMTLENCIVRGMGTARGVGVQDGARLSVRSCEVEGAHGVGVFVSGDDTVATLADSLITGTTLGSDMKDSTALGMTTQDSGVIDATRVRVTSNQGLGLLANGDGSRITCSECTISDNQFAGAAAVWGGTLEVADSLVEGTTPGVNLLGGAGIYAWSWGGDMPIVTITRSTIRDNPVAGVWFLENGVYQLIENEITGGQGEAYGTGTRGGDAIFARDGVTAWDGASGLLVQGNEISEAASAGVFLLESEALLVDNRYSANALDLVVQGEGCEAPLEGYGEAPQREYCPYYDYPTCYAEFFFVAMPSEPTEGERDKAALPARLARFGARDDSR